ncbi:MAG: acylphosphatase [Candidatus Omnitrophota bacterium]
MNEKHRVHAVFSGRVQGVGFRFTAEEIAMHFGVFGFVRNMYDGNVEVVAEGKKRQLEDFLEEIKTRMRGYISDSRIDWSPPSGEFSTFGIRF